MQMDLRIFISLFQTFVSFGLWMLCNCVPFCLFLSECSNCGGKLGASVILHLDKSHSQVVIVYSVSKTCLFISQLTGRWWRGRRVDLLNNLSSLFAIAWWIKLHCCRSNWFSALWYPEVFVSVSFNLFFLWFHQLLFCKLFCSLEDNESTAMMSCTSQLHDFEIVA